jgi:hypothetical protein
LVELHQKFADKGLVAVSVCLQADDPDVKSKPENVLKFLKEKKAAFTNVILDENEDFYRKKFSITGPPTVFVFDKKGKWRQFKDEGHYPEIGKLVEELLKEE